MIALHNITYHTATSSLPNRKICIRNAVVHLLEVTNICKNILKIYKIFEPMKQIVFHL